MVSGVIQERLSVYKQQPLPYDLGKLLSIYLKLVSNRLLLQATGVANTS